MVQVPSFAVVHLKVVALPFWKSVNSAPLSASPLSSCLMILTPPQLLIWTDCGAMKSFSAELNWAEDRLLRYADPKLVQVVEEPRSASRSSCASPKVRALRAPRPSELAEVIAVVLIPAVASLADDRSVAGPHWEPVHLRTEMDGLTPPCSRSYWTSRSFAVRILVTPLEDVVWLWLNSKSMFVLPWGSCTRVQNKFRKLRFAAVFSTYSRTSSDRSCYSEFDR
ncbi:hypothetical protein OH775_24770 [Streptomyces sp. NBC_01615]